MRVAVFAAVMCLSTVGLSLAADAQASIKEQTNIPAQGLGTALKKLAKERHFQVVFRSELVGTERTEGARGDLTTSEALTQLLKGTDLTYTYLDDKTVTIVPVSQQTAASQGENADADKKSADGRLAQATGPSPANSSEQSGSNPDRTSDSDQEEKQKLEELKAHIPEILVTGSRVMNVDVKRTKDDVQPYYILDAQTIEQSGATNVEDFLKQQLTMNTAGQTNSQAYGSTLGATSSINLRGLGTNETLILINGRRSAGISYLGTSNQPDITGIPLSAIERIEVLPSSASAIYGGAAVGGVVNIVLKHDYHGGTLSYSYDTPMNVNAPLHAVDGSYGFSIDATSTSVMIAGHYSDGSALQASDRLDLIQRGINIINKNSPSFFLNPANAFPGATTNISSADGSNLVLKNGAQLNYPITYIPPGTAPGSDLTTGLLRNAGLYNLALAPGTGEYGLNSTIGQVPTIKALMATIRQQFGSTLEAFSELSSRSNITHTPYNPITNTNNSYLVPATAPDNPFQQDVNVVFPSDVSPTLNTDSVTHSVTVGLIQKLPKNWSTEIDYTWSQSSFEFAYESAATNALNADLASGRLNPFVDTIAFPLPLMAYLAPTTYSGASTLNDLGLRFGGPLWFVPWRDATLTIGLEHRKEGTDNSNQYVHASDTADVSDVVYFGQSQTTNSVYAELALPLVNPENAKPGLHSLEFQLAGRSERYTVFAGTPFDNILPVSAQANNPPQGQHVTINYASNNPTVGLKYGPVEWLTIRSSFAKAFLPPTAAQLLPDPVLQTGNTIYDPKLGETYTVNEIQGGNPLLKPQTSADWDVGVIVEPKEGILSGLRADLEYYCIKQPNYITTPAAQQVVSDPALSGRVTRDPATGRITTVDVSLVNATEYKTSGFDVSLDFRKPTPLGNLSFRAAATFITHDLRQYTIGGPFLDYAGFPSEGGEGKTKANASLSWDLRRWKVTWTTTYYGSYQQGYGSPNSPYALQYGPYPIFTDAQGGFSIPSQTYHDLLVSYTVPNVTESAGPTTTASKALSGVSVQVGVKNILNSRPPFDAFYFPYFYSPYGDPRLRDLWIRLSKSF